MAKASALGSSLEALLKEIEEAYDNELSRTKNEVTAVEKEFIQKSIETLSKEEIDFVKGYFDLYEQKIVIETLLFMGKLEKPTIKKTHSHIQVITTISNAKKENPSFSATELISCVAEKLSMTSRAVRKHYYLK